jgi:hypothetical protein
MNRVTATYTAPSGEHFETTFDSWATSLLAQYDSAKAALEKAYPGQDFPFEKINIHVA